MTQNSPETRVSQSRPAEHNDENQTKKNHYAKKHTEMQGYNLKSRINPKKNFVLLYSYNTTWTLH